MNKQHGLQRNLTYSEKNQKNKDKKQKKRQYERAQMKLEIQKIFKLEELKGHQSQIDAIHRNIADHDEKMRLLNIMEYLHNEDTKSQVIKDTCYMKQEEMKEDIDLNNVQEVTNEHRTDLKYREGDRKRQEELKRELLELKNIEFKAEQKKSNITKTKNEPEYKARIDNNESMHHESSKSTGTSLPTTCPSLPVTTCPSLPATSSTCPSLPATSSTCPSLPDNTSPSLPSTFPSLTTDDDFIHQDLNKTSASLSTNTMVCIEHFCYNQDKSHEPEADTYTQSTWAIPDKSETIQSDSTNHTSIPHLKECESTQEAITTMNKGKRILQEHMKSRHFAQGDQITLLLPDWNNEDIKAEVDNFTSLATIPEEEEESSTPIPEIDVSLPASNQIDIPKVITLDDIALQKVKDTKVFPDHADFFTGVSETFPVLQFENNPESNNMDNTKFHPPSTQGAFFLQKGTNELLQHCSSTFVKQKIEFWFQTVLIFTKLKRGSIRHYLCDQYDMETTAS
uniref:Uncharacterized protein n=1 Tax=Biomphalaria glabrata TaxID=6526 RepID=A0A2C9LXM7_BIOGL